MMEPAIEDHIREGMAAAYPDIPEENIQVVFGSGQFRTERNKGRRVLGSEELSVDVLVHAASPVDRVPFIRAFPRREVTIDETRVLQEYLGHERRDNPDAARLETTIFRMRFTHDVEDVTNG